MDHADPVAAADQLLLLVAEIGFGEQPLWIFDETLAEVRFDQPMQEMVDAETLDRAVDGEGIGAFNLLDAGQLMRLARARSASSLSAGGVSSPRSSNNMVAIAVIEGRK